MIVSSGYKQMAADRLFNRLTNSSTTRKISHIPVSTHVGEATGLAGDSWSGSRRRDIWSHMIPAFLPSIEWCTDWGLCLINIYTKTVSHYTASFVTLHVYGDNVIGQPSIPQHSQNPDVVQMRVLTELKCEVTLSEVIVNYLGGGTSAWTHKHVWIATIRINYIICYGLYGLIMLDWLEIYCQFITFTHYSTLFHYLSLFISMLWYHHCM